MTGLERREAETGSITVLTVGFLAVALALVLVVTYSSAAFLARRGLAATCDGAALAAAQSVTGLNRVRDGSALQIDPAGVGPAVESYRAALAAAGDRDAADGGGLELSAGVEPDGAEVVVRCSRPLHLPASSALGLDPRNLPVLVATARARAQVAAP